MLFIGLAGGFFAGLFVPASAKSAIIDLVKKLYNSVIGLFKKK